MASEGLAPTPTPPLGMVSTADATLEGGNLAKYAILQKAGILVTQPDGSGCASPKDQKPEDSSEDDSLVCAECYALPCGREVGLGALWEQS